MILTFPIVLATGWSFGKGKMTRVDIYFPALMPSNRCFIYANDWVKRIKEAHPKPYPICVEYSPLFPDCVLIWF